MTCMYDGTKTRHSEVEHVLPLIILYTVYRAAQPGAGGAIYSIDLLIIWQGNPMKLSA